MRYTVNAPTHTGEITRDIGAALTPNLTRPASAWSSRGPISGSPGTRAIHAPRPVAVPQERTGMATMGTSRSSDAPDVIFPSMYYLVGPDQERAPVSRISDNQMPVPALRPANVIVAKPYLTRKGGQRQVTQPQVVQRWLGMNSRG